MAFQPINFASIPAQGLAPLLQGMRAGMMPMQEMRAAQKDNLANALSQINLQYLPEELRSQIELKQAQTGKSRAEGAQKQILSDILRQYQGGQDGSAVGAGGQQDDFAKTLFNKLVLGVEETPGQKQQREVSTARQKKEMEQDFLTSGQKKEHESVLARAPQFLRGLQKIIDAPSPVDLRVPIVGARWRPSAFAEHENLVKDIGETLARLRGYPAGIGGQEKAISQIERAPFESDVDYRKRLKKFFPEIAKTALEASQALGKKPEPWIYEMLGNQNNNAANNDPLGIR